MDRSFAPTTVASDTMQQLHDRMPVTREPGMGPLWLHESDGDAPVMLRLAVDDELQIWPVSRAVHSVRKNGASAGLH